MPWVLFLQMAQIFLQLMSDNGLLCTMPHITDIQKCVKSYLPGQQIVIQNYLTPEIARIKQPSTSAKIPKLNLDSQ
jgi:hypothetical protein